MRASSYCKMLGRSWTREIRPTPIAPTLMRLLGAYCPNTDGGTIAGNPAIAAVAPAVRRKVLREIASRRLLMAFPPIEIQETRGRRAESCLDLQHIRILLCANHQFRREQTLFLILRDMRSIDDVGHEFRSERQRHVVAIDVLRLFFVDEEQVISTFASGDIDVLSKLDVAFGA